MFNNQHLLDLIEDAERRHPLCEQCGLPTTVLEQDESLWLECSGLASRPGGLRSLLRLDFASLHTRRAIADFSTAA
jgi:hypothetical protein